jgi:hypothetical protein
VKWLLNVVPCFIVNPQRAVQIASLKNAFYRVGQGKRGVSLWKQKSLGTTDLEAPHVLNLTSTPEHTVKVGGGIEIIITARCVGRHYRRFGRTYYINFHGKSE